MVTFQIMGEFVNGYEKLSSIGCRSIRSARTKSNHPNYILTVEIAKAVAKSGYGVITGGGPGIMEAANKGANEVGGISVGLNINLPMEQESNTYIDKDKLIDFQHFFVRKLCCKICSRIHSYARWCWNTRRTRIIYITSNIVN